MSNLKTKNARVLQTLKVHTSDVTSMDFWGNTLLATGSSDKTVRIWKWNVGDGFVEENFSPLLGHKYGVTCVRISPKGGVLASSSIDGTIILWDLAQGDKTDSVYQENGEAIRGCAFTPDGFAMASADDSGSVCIWGKDKNLLRTLKFHEEAVHVVAFSPDSEVLLTACTMGNVRIAAVDHSSENPNSDTICCIDNAHDMGVFSADFCKLIHTDPLDSRTIIYTAATCGSDHFIKIWRFYYIQSSTCCSEARSSRLVPQSSGEHTSGTSTIYNTESMNAECVLTISAHGSSVTCVRFNSQGTYLVSSSLDKTLKIWDLQGNCLKTLAEHTRYVNCISINLASTIIASGSNDRTIVIWDTTSSLTLDSHLSDPTHLVFSVAANHADIPLDLMCPITHELMREPVTAEDGFTYERDAITSWFDRGKITSPMTNAELSSFDLKDNDDIKERIDAFLKSVDFDSFND